MRPVRVVAAADEREIRVALRAVAPEDELADAVELVLVLPGLDRAHSFEDREAGEARRLAEHGELALALDQPQRVECRRQVADLDEREPLLHERDEAPLARGAAVERIVGGVGRHAQGEVAAHRAELRGRERRVHCVPAAPEVLALDLLGERPGRGDRVDARQLPDLVRVFGGEHLAFAALASLVARREKQRRLLRSAVEEQVCVRHLDAAEVVEVVGLAEARVARGNRRALDDGEGVGADRFVDLRPPRGELLGREVGGEEREAFLGEGGGGGQAEGERRGGAKTAKRHGGPPRGRMLSPERRPVQISNWRRSW